VERANYQPVHSCVIAHNTIVNCGKSGIRLGQKQPKADWQIPPFGNHFINNMIIGQQGMMIEHVDSHYSIWRANIVWPIKGAQAGYLHDGITAADPQMERSAGMFRPVSKNSPLVDPSRPDFFNIYMTVSEVAIDCDGQLRDSQPDIGCDELSHSETIRGPLNPSDVGPDWMKGDPRNIRRIPSPRPVPKYVHKTNHTRPN
jgi:hypothetical protein